MAPTSSAPSRPLAGLRWLLARAGWALLGWRLRAGLRSALGSAAGPAAGPPTTPRRAVRSRPGAGYAAYPYSAAA